MKNKIEIFNKIMIVCLLLFAVEISAQTITYKSHKVENSIVINKPANQIWDIISNFENLPKLVPKVVKSVELSGAEVYTSWIISLHNNQLVKEEMTYFNIDEMELAYIMTKTPMPLSDYFAIQKIEVVDEQKSKVTFTTYFNAISPNQENLTKTFNGFQQTFLKNIKNLIE